MHSTLHSLLILGFTCIGVACCNKGGDNCLFTMLFNVVLSVTNIANLVANINACVWLAIEPVRPFMMHWKAGGADDFCIKNSATMLA